LNDTDDKSGREFRVCPGFLPDGRWQDSNN
jgi:hypothetical protein